MLYPVSLVSNFSCIPVICLKLMLFLISLQFVINFLVTIIKKFLKALAMSVGSLNFSSFTSKVGTGSTEYTSLVTFLIIFHVVFISLLDFAMSLL